LSYAIDFGTTNTVITRWNEASQQAETLNLPGISLGMGQCPDLIPSLLYAENAATEEIWVGQQVRDRGLDINNDPRFFRSFKRGIGAQIQGFLPELDGHKLTFEQIGQWFLSQVLAQARMSHPDVAQSLILTVPVDSFETYRHWLGEVCTTLQIEQIRILDEPTAAALGYGMVDQDLVLVVDFGGGTLDLSLVRLDSMTAGKPLGFILKWGEKRLADSQTQLVKTARVLAKAGQNLGGTDIDHWLVDYFTTTQNLAPSALVSRLAERLKIQLSLQQQATEIFFDEETFESFELSLERSSFEDLLSQHQFFERLDESMVQVLQQGRRQGIEVDDIKAVLMVGGTTQIPAVQSWIQSYFNSSKIRSDRPFESVALGALQLTRGLDLKDFLYHSYGIRYWDRRQNCHNWHPLIPAGQAYPMTEPVELVLGASTEGQPSIELVLGELGNSTRGTEIFFDGDHLITRNLVSHQSAVQPLNDRDGSRSIAQLTPPGHPGSDRIKALFYVDEQRVLRITVEDLLTQEQLLNYQAVAQLS
jgi:molecular chaperone DnaK (HSP70)